MFGHKPFLVLADYLTRANIAVLRMDDRGVGKSTGRLEGATTKDFASDILAAVAFLKSKKELAQEHIGLIVTRHAISSMCCEQPTAVISIRSMRWLLFNTSRASRPYSTIMCSVSATPK